MVQLLEVVDNGNRTGGNPEALYLYGLGGPDGLRILGGSTFVIDNLNVYTTENNAWVHINDLFGPGQVRIPYDQGFIELPEPATRALMSLGLASLIRRCCFDGRPMVFPRKAACLKAAWEAACALGCEYNRWVAYRSPPVETDGAEGGKPEDAPAAPGVIDRETIQAKAAAGAAAEVRFCTDLAKSVTLNHIGRVDDAVRLLKACAVRPA